MSRLKKIHIISFLFILSSTFILRAQVPPAKQDTLPSVKRDSVDLKYPFKSNQQGSLFLTDPSKVEIIYDPTIKRYIIIEKVGGYEIKHPVFMTQEEYQDYTLKKGMLEYFKEKISATDSRKKNAVSAQKDLLPKYYVNSNFFESIFGSNTIEVNPTGSVLIKMGGLYQKVDNPQLSERNRKSFTFDFDQEISASILAQVGTRLKVTAQYDTQSTFNFQNQIKLEYTPTEDDIIQKIEVGNVSMPLKNSLITGAQSLFGVKTQLQFGKTTVTGVFAEQKSQTRSVSAQGGSTIQEFELQATDYDENRHFFLAHYFRDNYNNALANFPLINSEVNITKVEVWVTNRSANTENIRNIVALADLGEGSNTNIGPANVTPYPGQLLPDNDANNINNILTPTNPVREIATVSNGLSPYS
ncbi:MAG TPA: cell surface protein SprA, partial [Flavobacteriaceae bacterium]|nr:cell surface protein SprA [Flavobacteriaceae bacterium]